MTHTKGKWTVEITPGGMHGTKIISVQPNICSCSVKLSNQSEAEANAKLIAAAPELLAQVKNARDTIFKAGGHVQRMNISQYAELYDQLSQAIKKATA